MCWQWRRQICVHRHNKPCRKEHCRGVRWYVLRVSAYGNKDLPLSASDVDDAVKVSNISTPFTCWHTRNVSCFLYFFHESPDRMGWDLIPGESSESWRSRCRCFEKILERKTKFIKSLASKGTRLIFRQSIPKLKKKSWVILHLSDPAAPQKRCSAAEFLFLSRVVHFTKQSISIKKRKESKKKQVAGCLKSCQCERESPDMQPE